MKMRVSTWGQVSSGLLISMLAACGRGRWRRLWFNDARSHCELLAARSGCHHQLRSGHDGRMDIGL
jgi:hypothetical protein